MVEERTAGKRTDGRIARKMIEEKKTARKIQEDRGDDRNEEYRE